MTLVYSTYATPMLREGPPEKQLNAHLTAAVPMSNFGDRWPITGSIEETESCELGVAVVLPDSCDDSFAVDMGSNDFSTDADLPLETFKPFGILYNRIVSTICLAERGISLEELLQTRWRASYSHLIANQLWAGTTNPSLASEDTVIAGTATSVRLGVATLEMEAGKLYGNQEVVFHVALSTLAVGVSDMVFLLDSDGRYRTASGNLVIGDAGYVPTGAEAAPPIYVSGPVHWAVSPGRYTTVFSDDASLRVNKIWGSYIGSGIVTFPADCPVLSKTATLT